MGAEKQCIKMWWIKPNSVCDCARFCLG